ncbi:MAG: putative quinol monooxygenase [Acholeplasmataceae bacterium]
MSTTQLPMIVKFEVKKDKIDFVKQELLKILEPTRKEQGCLKYDLHQDLEDPSIFMFYEVWETKEAWMAHDTKKHILDFKKNIEGAVNQISVNKLTLI